MVVGQLGRPVPAAVAIQHVSGSHAARKCRMRSVQPFQALSSRHSTLDNSRHSCALGQALGVKNRTRRRNLHSQTVAGLWSRPAQNAAADAAASAAAAQYAAVLSIPLWQHAAQSFAIVVASLVVASTVSRFLIESSGRLEAGEVCTAVLQTCIFTLLWNHCCRAPCSS